MQRAQHFSQVGPNIDWLSLYVSGKNQWSKGLYEKLSFHTHLQENSFVW
ncbi:hypothetical protein ABH966_005294 [Lysinibacillus sp. RC46]